jgi:hypothetical protein
MEWSKGRRFKVEVEDRLVRILDKVADTLKANGLSDDFMDEVLMSGASEVNEISVSKSGSQTGGYRTQDKIGILGNEVGFNTWYGDLTGLNLTSGLHNSLFGSATGWGIDTGNYNTCMGGSAGYSTTAGHGNTFLGFKAGFMNTTGYENTYIGVETGYSNQEGYGNVFLGQYAGFYEFGSNKLYIDNSDSFFPLIYGEFDNEIVSINGKLGVGTQSPTFDLEVETTSKNAVLILNRTDGPKVGLASMGTFAACGTVTDHPLNFITKGKPRMSLKTDNSLVMLNGARCTADGVWQDASSRAYKENIVDLTTQEAKDVLFKLNPVRYNYKNEKEDEHLGFIAEDVPDLVASKDRKGMSPMDVVAVLTKVVQEQQDTISELQERISRLEKKSP